MKFIFKHPVILIACIGAVTLFFLFQLPKIQMDNDVASFIPKDNPAFLANEETERVYGEDLAISVALTASGESFFTADNIALVGTLTKQLENIPDVSRVTSFTTTDHISGNAGGIEIGPLVDTEAFSGSEKEIESLLEKLRSWEPYRRTLYSPDLKSTQILVILGKNLPAERREAVLFAVEDSVKAILPGDVISHIAGTPAIAVLISSNMRADLQTLVPLVILVVFGVLYISFRRISAVMLPLITVLVSTVWTLGLMAALGISLSMVATVIPVLMVAVGSAYSIHIVSHFIDERTAAPAAEPSLLLDKTFAAVGRPVFLAGLTTVAGFGSLMISKVIPMRDFGIFTSVGVLTALFISLTLLPALMLVSPVKSHRGKAGKHAVLSFLGRITEKKAGVVITAVLLLLFSGYGAKQLIIDNALVDYFLPKTAIWKADEFLRNEFSGTRGFSINIKGREKGDLTDPRILKSMDDLSRHLSSEYPEVSKVLSFSDFIKRMNLVLHSEAEPSLSAETPQETGGDFSFSFFEETGTSAAETQEQEEPGSNMTDYADQDFNEIPTDPGKYGLQSEKDLKNLISQYLLLYSGNLDRWADDSLEPSQARMMVQIGTKGNSFTRKVVPDIQSFAAANFPEGYEIEISGIALIENALVDLIVDAQKNSILLSLLMVFVILLLNYRSVRAGIVGIFPLAFSLLINFAFMGYSGIPLDITTAMVASVAMGIGIDYTLHYMSRYESFRRGGVEPYEAVEKTVSTTGKAILFNAFSVGAGFSVLLLSQFKPLKYFGLLIALTMLTSSLGAMTLVPVVIEVFKPWLNEKKFIFRRKS